MTWCAHRARSRHQSVRDTHPVRERVGTRVLTVAVHIAIVLLLAGLALVVPRHLMRSEEPAQRSPASDDAIPDDVYFDTPELGDDLCCIACSAELALSVAPIFPEEIISGKFEDLPWLDRFFLRLLYPDIDFETTSNTVNDARQIH